MKKAVSLLLAVIFILSSLSVSAFAVTVDEADKRLSNEREKFTVAFNTKFDTDNSGNITAADARNTLLVSAGLSMDNIDASKMDTDGDGIITAIDARNILRVSAKLDSMDKYMNVSDTLNYFDAIIDSIKLNKYTYYKWNKNTTDNVTYTDDGVVADINKQLSRYDWMTGEKIDFGAQLTESKGTFEYPYNRNSIRYVDYEYPVSGKTVNDLDESCYLTTDNVSKTEYKQNQSFTYEHHMNSANPTFKSNTITGLDSITVWIKTDSFNKFPDNDDMKCFNHGRIFNMLSKKVVMDSIEEGNSMGSLEGFGDMGSCELSAGFISMKYYDSYITVYMNPNNGKPVAVDYNMHYDLKMYMTIDVDFGVMLNADGRIELTNTVTEKTVYSFWNSNLGTKYQLEKA